MLNVSNAQKIYAHVGPVDMRRGINGLSGIVREGFGTDPTDGSLFLFMNRRRDRLKILYFCEGGFWLYYRVLESGTFEELKSRDDSCRMELDATQLTMLLSGVSLVGSTRRRRRYEHPRDKAA